MHLREHSRRLAGERAQQRVLLLREMQPLAAQPDLAAERIELKRTHPEPSRTRAPAVAAQQRDDPCAQLGIAERLADVVVCGTPESGSVASPRPGGRHLLVQPPSRSPPIGAAAADNRRT